jgi:hypothetical protein
MTAHRCEASPPEAGHNPLTTLRVLKMLAAIPSRDQAVIDDVVTEMGNCPDCLRRAWLATLGYTTGLIKQHAPDFQLAIELQIAAAEATDR